jgi:DNA-binding transcriptional regulator YhcF (GntR family)
MRQRHDVLELLRQRLVSAIHFGSLRPGDRVPSARKLTRELHADPRVILNAYRRLEREELVERRRGTRGYFLTGARSASGQLAPSAHWLVEILEQALAQGVHVPRFSEHVRRSLETVRLRVACVECNTDQVEWICGELADDYGFESSSVETRELGTASDPHAALRRSDLVVTTASHVGEVGRLARRLAKPFVIATPKREIMDEVLRLLRAGPVYFVCADDRYARKLRKLYANEAPADHVELMVLGKHDPATIPPGAPTWMLRSVRDRLGGVPPHVRALPTLRLFSTDTTRELLSFVVRANSAAAEAMQASSRS